MAIIEPPTSPKTHNRLSSSSSSQTDNSSPLSLAHYSEKDKVWVKKANAAAAGTLLASHRRLAHYLNSLPPDSEEAISIRSFLRYGV